jgi:hypothetical protein
VKFGRGQASDLFADSVQEETNARRAVRCAFVSTNSIVQGEQVGVLWGWMLAQGIQIQFAHRTFQWSNDAPGRAAVHCVIVGFGMEARAPRLFDYDDIKGNAHEVKVTNVNPYLVDAPNVLLPIRQKPICNVSEINWGNKPVDGGFLLLDTNERENILAKEPKLISLIKPLISAREFLNGGERWCFWLVGTSPQTLSDSPELLSRMNQVRSTRLASVDPGARKLAETPSLFRDTNNPQSYIVIPVHTSERRLFIPIGFFHGGEIVHNSCQTIPNATPYEFGILSSTMHNAWVRYTCGRLESRYRYSAGIVYNNYPWPEAISSKAREAIESAAQAVLDARAVHQAGANPASLATLYNPTTMPANLLAAHKALDKAVDAAYAEKDKQAKGLKSDAERVAFLFGLYARYTSLLG